MNILIHSRYCSIIFFISAHLYHSFRTSYTNWQVKHHGRVCGLAEPVHGAGIDVHGVHVGVLPAAISLVDVAVDVDQGLHSGLNLT